MRTRADLPHKVCVFCGRPFSWRKKWARAWAEITTCSDRCRSARRRRERASRGRPTPPA
ncbi:MAG: DUF2256 domain-containing protein [Polyangia bacterium]